MKNSEPQSNDSKKQLTIDNAEKKFAHYCTRAGNAVSAGDMEDWEFWNALADKVWDIFNDENANDEED